MGIIGSGPLKESPRAARRAWLPRLSREMRLRADYKYRIYTAAQFRRLLSSVPAWELCDVHDFWYEIDEPRELDDTISDTVFVLRKRI